MSGSLSAFTPFCGTDSDMVGAAVKVFWWRGGDTQKCSTTPDVARFSRPRFALLRSPTGACVLGERADLLPAAGWTVAAELTEPATYNRVSYFGLARLSRHGLSMLAEQ